ncbi:MAG: hypothetical protein QOK40_3231 [Miltoncostaeaceae bacterium]|jgi:uncharacterized protein YcnI|nr:hypothetical protein [Miltoncostaeaceae bacterium]
MHVVSPTGRRRARRLSRLALRAAVAVASLAVVQQAFAHAAISPPIAKDKELQQFTLSVPTEKEGATTTTVEFAPPAGFNIDSFDPPPPGWKLDLQTVGSGEEQTFTRATWTGGHVPTGQAAVFDFNASTDGAKTYVFAVRQTYSDGSVVDWAGSESSDTPAVRLESVSSLGGGGGSTLAIVALIVGGVGILIGVVAIGTGRRPVA